jgi:hypothetical protein
LAKAIGGDLHSSAAAQLGVTSDEKGKSTKEAAPVVTSSLSHASRTWKAAAAGKVLGCQIYHKCSVGMPQLSACLVSSC